MVINSKTENVVDRVMEITGAQGFEIFLRSYAFAGRH